MSEWKRPMTMHEWLTNQRYVREEVAKQADELKKRKGGQPPAQEKP